MSTTPSQGHCTYLLVRVVLWVVWGREHPIEPSQVPSTPCREAKWLMNSQARKFWVSAGDPSLKLGQKPERCACPVACWARTQGLGTAVGLVAAIGTVSNTITYRVMLQTEEQVTAELILGTAPWRRARTIWSQNPSEFPSLLLGITEGEVAGDMEGSDLQCPGATAWYQAWKPDPSTSLSETKDTRR